MNSRFFRSSAVIVAMLTAVTALTFAAFTNHTWEDYYITFRSSKNLATGNGLVFNVGDRLHTFTSPLGVLLPAVAYLLTGNNSDAAALWIFRLMSSAALGLGTALLWSIARQKKYALVVALFLVAAMATEAKTVDFTINGMETGFMILFLAYAIWAHVTPCKRQWLHLGGAWAGLMWTRPDSFVYIGTIAAGFWFFNRREESNLTRKDIFVLCLKAGLVTTALYLPWLLIAWGYYGTPVPHTITAKSGIGDPRTLGGVIETIVKLPFNSNEGGNTLADAFLPSYYMIGGWPAELIAYARAIGTVCAVLWLFPFLRSITRAASFAFFGAHVYLTYFPYFAFPWYLPPTTLLGLFTLASLFNQAWGKTTGSAESRSVSAIRRSIVVICLGILGASSWTIYACGRAYAVQQRLIEDGNRRKIGEWLHANAKPNDTVFMEPLGYIGYFSGLKTYDFPGMSSRESVEARQKVGNDWADLIRYLQPSWLVLRPAEVNRIGGRDPQLLKHFYTPVKTFDVRAKLNDLDVNGLPYLTHDASFTVFKNIRPMSIVELSVRYDSPFPVSQQVVGDYGVTLVHAPGKMEIDVPDSVSTLKVAFGFPTSAYEGADPTDGANFIIEWQQGEKRSIIMQRKLQPAENHADRGMQNFETILPESTAKAVLIFRTETLNTMNKDWTCWSQPEFH